MKNVCHNFWGNRTQIHGYKKAGIFLKKGINFIGSNILKILLYRVCFLIKLLKAVEENEEEYSLTIYWFDLEHNLRSRYRSHHHLEPEWNFFLYSWCWSICDRDSLQTFQTCKPFFLCSPGLLTLIQLNMYNFHKNKNNVKELEFFHKLFRRDAK